MLFDSFYYATQEESAKQRGNGKVLAAFEVRNHNGTKIYELWNFNKLRKLRTRAMQ